MNEGVDYTRVAANAFVVADGQALLVEFSGGTEREHYNFPGVGVQLGETLEQAVKREVMEETCLAVTVERLLLMVESIGSRNTNTIRGQRLAWNEVRFFFLCRPSPDAGEPRLPDEPDENQTGVVWVPLEKLPFVEVIPQVSQALLSALTSDVATPLIVANPHA